MTEPTTEAVRERAQRSPSHQPQAVPTTATGDEQEAAGSTMRRSTAMTLATCAGLVGFVLSWSYCAPAAPPEHRPTGRGIAATAGPEAAPVPAPATAAPPLERSAAAAPTTATHEPRLDFADAVERLRELGERTAVLAQQDDLEGAQTSDQEARSLFTTLMDSFADAGDRALHRVTDIPQPTTDPHDHGRRIVLQLVLAADCERRHEEAQRLGDPTRLDALVAAILLTMPMHGLVAEIGEQVLAGRPFLRLVHEHAVLELVRLAGEQLFPRRTAQKLLTTLWDNVQRSGERSSDDMSRLAMLLLADQDASQRTAACRQLLLDERYRGVVLSWLHEHRDTTVARELANLAAAELAPNDALAVLRQIGGLVAQPTAAYLLLGHRSPQVLADAYEQQLAANTHPEMRRELIAGLGMLGRGDGLRLARLALQHDPAPEVRLQALFALTANAPPEEAERAAEQLLDDPAIGGDGLRLEAVVLALSNLEHGDDPNRIARLAARLRLMPLSVAARENLEALVARSLPNGGR
jgi:hypothetical protein